MIWFWLGFFALRLKLCRLLAVFTQVNNKFLQQAIPQFQLTAKVHFAHARHNHVHFHQQEFALQRQPGKTTRSIPHLGQAFR